MQRSFVMLAVVSFGCTAEMAPTSWVGSDGPSGTAHSRYLGAGPYSSLREAGATPHISGREGPPVGVPLQDHSNWLDVSAGDLVAFGMDVSVVSSSRHVATPFAAGTVARVEGVVDDWVKLETYGALKRTGWVFADTGWEVIPQPELPRLELNKASYVETWGDLMHGDPSTDQVAQGYLNDCFLVAGMAAVAYATPNLIEDRLDEDYEGGTYTFTRYSLANESSTGRRRLQRATFDSWLPTAAGHLRYALKNTDRPSYAVEQLNRGSHPLWPAVIEKGWAALEKDGYNTLDAGGFEDEVMERLTGKAVESWMIAKADEDEMLELIAKSADQWKPMTAGTKPRLSKKAPVVANHVYVVTYATDDRVYLINPWEGHKEFHVSRADFFKSFEQLSISQARG